MARRGHDAGQIIHRNHLFHSIYSRSSTADAFLLRPDGEVMAQVRETSLPSGSLVLWSSGGGGGASPEEKAKKAGEIEKDAVGATKACSGQDAKEMKLELLQDHKPVPEGNLTWSDSGGDKEVLPSSPPRCYISSSPLCQRRKPRPRPPASARSRGPPGLSAPPQPPSHPPPPLPPPPLT